MTDEENEVFFYDAVQDTAELSSDEESASNSKRSPRLHCLNRKLATLFRKRAHIRNKKVYDNNDIVIVIITVYFSHRPI